MGQYLKLLKGASPAPGRFLKWVPLAPRISCKKTIYEKKGSAQNPAFCAGLYSLVTNVSYHNGFVKLLDVFFFAAASSV